MPLSDVNETEVDKNDNSAIILDANKMNLFLSNLDTSVLNIITYLIQAFLDLISSGKKLPFFESLAMDSLASVHEIMGERFFKV